MAHSQHRRGEQNARVRRPETSEVRAQMAQRRQASGANFGSLAEIDHFRRMRPTSER